MYATSVFCTYNMSLGFTFTSILTFTGNFTRTLTSFVIFCETQKYQNPASCTIAQTAHILNTQTYTCSLHALQMLRRVTLESLHQTFHSGHCLHCMPSIPHPNELLLGSAGGGTCYSGSCPYLVSTSTPYISRHSPTEEGGLKRGRKCLYSHVFPPVHHILGTQVQKTFSWQSSR